MPHDLLQSQRNEVFLAIGEAGFTPDSFDWETRMTAHGQIVTHVPVLRYVGSNYYFHFDLLKGVHWCRFSPGEEKLVVEAYPGSWTALRSYFASWLANLHREVEAPDLWSSISEESKLFGATKPVAETDNSAFLPQEKQKLHSSIDEIRRYFRATNSEPERLAFVEERLNYLISAADRLGRKDWQIIALGVLANIVVGAALAPDAARDLLRVAGAALSWILGGSPLLPSPL